MFSSRVYNDGKYLDMTERLSTALQYFLLENQDRTMWIGAICINQRARQVLFMHHVYSRIAQVFICLGKGFEFSAMAFNFL